MAPVTIDPDDWEFAEPYDDAIARHDRRRQPRIRKEYLAYTAKRISWSQRSAGLLFGRDIAHVMLLHCTRLNADTLDALAKVFHRAGLRPVTLTEAMLDSASRLASSSPRRGATCPDRTRITGDLEPLAIRSVINYPSRFARSTWWRIVWAVLGSIAVGLLMGPAREV